MFEVTSAQARTRTHAHSRTLMRSASRRQPLSFLSQATSPQVIERKAKVAKKEVAFGDAAASGPSPLMFGAAVVAVAAAAAYFTMVH